MPSSDSAFLPRTEFQQLLDALHQAGFSCLGPQVRDGAILYEPLRHCEDLPQGYHDRQQPAQYRLEQDASQRWFAWANGPQALKPQVFAPRETLWTGRVGADGGLSFHEQTDDAPPLAVIGVRACDIAALALMDAHFLQQPYPDNHYARRRERLFIIAVHCSHPAATCFCVSTGDGPEASQGYDLALHELDEGFLIDAGSERGAALLANLPLTQVTPQQIAASQQQTQQAITVQTRRLPEQPLDVLLFDNLNHARWDEVAERCLACGNCTAVCPTCFCSSNSEVPSLDGQQSEHVREWGSCFSASHAYITGHQVRPDIRSRYRQWLTHKLGGWIEQYGRSGCVGCGRCMTWCPVGIDLTEEVAAIAATPRQDNERQQGEPE